MSLSVSRSRSLHYSSQLFIPPRNLTAKFSQSSPHDRTSLLGVLSKVRLKRKIPQLGGSSSSSSTSLSAAACVYSAFIVAVSQFASSAIDDVTVGLRGNKIPTLSLSRLINDYGLLGDQPIGAVSGNAMTRGRSASVARFEALSMTSGGVSGTTEGGSLSPTTLSPSKHFASLSLSTSSPSATTASTSNDVVSPIGVCSPTTVAETIASARLAMKVRIYHISMFYHVMCNITIGGIRSIELSESSRLCSG